MKYRTAILAATLLVPADVNRFPSQKRSSPLVSFGSEDDLMLEHAADRSEISLLQHRLSVDRRYEDVVDAESSATKAQHSPGAKVESKAQPHHAEQLRHGGIAAAEPSLAASQKDRAHLAAATATVATAARMPPMPSHPFPGLNWSEVELIPAIICSSVLFLAGVLCAAGGIGGGGVYVTVLMVAGQLSPHDAVPLSKAIVFFGSLSSLVLNVRKSMVKPEGGQAKTLIDYNICRLVVPGALVGTLFGVFLNSLLAPWLIVALLCFILITMTVMSTRKFLEQWRVEQAEELAIAKLGLDQAEQANPKLASNPWRPNDSNEHPSLPGSLPQCMGSKAEEAVPGKLRGVLMQGEGVAWFMLLMFIICCGTFRSHAMTCYDDIQGDPGNLFGRESCARPVMKMLMGNRLLEWMQGKVLAELILMAVVSVPISLCVLLLTGYSWRLVRSEGWTMPQACAYMGMSFFTGCFAGLVGIGGGLVFSPFMLWMGVEPSIAVATSSTCVIFTSSSTTFQYLLTDRIILSLTLIYGIANLIASYVGTSFVHALQDRFHAKPSFITGIVCLGVFASVILSVYKLVAMGVAE